MSCNRYNSICKYIYADTHISYEASKCLLRDVGHRKTYLATFEHLLVLATTPAVQVDAAALHLRQRTRILPL